MKEKQKYDYFWMTVVSNLKGLKGIRYGVAYSPRDYGSRAPDVPIESFVDPCSVAFFKERDEVPSVFELRDGEFSDYLCNDTGYPMFSIKLKNIIEENVQNKVHTKWIKVKVRDSRNDKIVVYNMPLFENLIDTIDYEHSECDSASAYIPRYSLKKIKDLDFFPKHDKISLRDMKEDETKPYFVDNHFIVSKRLKDILIKNNVTGMEFIRENFIDDINPELEKQWGEVIEYWINSYRSYSDCCNFLFNVDRYLIGIKMLTLPSIKKAARSEDLMAYNVKYSTDDGLPPTKELESRDCSKYRKIEDKHKINVRNAIRQGYEAINELIEEEFIKNNLRRLFEYYEDITYSGSYLMSYIRPAYSAVGLSVDEIIKTLSGKTPIKDEKGIIRFIGVPKRLQSRSNELTRAAIAVKEMVQSAIASRETCTPEYIFNKYRITKNQLIDKDAERRQGNAAQQLQQRVKDYAREIINDKEMQKLNEYDAWYVELLTMEADEKWEGIKHGEYLEKLRKHSNWAKTHMYIIPPENPLQDDYEEVE